MSSKRDKRRASIDSDDSFDSLENYIPTPPDGGWGWVVVFCSFMAHVIVDGCAYTFGIFLPHFVYTFGSSKSEVGTVGSMLAGVYLFSGVVVGGLINKLGCRPVALIGSGIACVGFVLSSFSTSITMLIITYGVMGGVGFGMMYLPAIVSVGFYFERRRALATGIAVCGSGVGMLVFAPLSEYLLEVYSWRNALFIIAGIVLNGAVLSMLVRPLVAKPRRRKRDPEIDEQPNGRPRYISEMSESGSVQDTLAMREKLLQAKTMREKKLQDVDSDTRSFPSDVFVRSPDGERTHKVSVSMSDRTDVIDEAGRVHRESLTISDGATDQTPSSVGTPAHTPVVHVTDDASVLTSESGSTNIGNMSPISNNDLKVLGIQKIIPHTHSKSEVITHGKGYSNGNLGSPEHAPLMDSDGLRHRQKGGSGSGQKASMIFSRSQLTASRPHIDATMGSRALITSMRNLQISKEDMSRPMYRADILYAGSTALIPQFTSQPDVKSYVTSITSIPFDEEDDKSCWTYLPLPKSLVDTLREMLNFSLLLYVPFLFICLGNVTVFMGYFVPFIYLVDFAALSGTDKVKAASLLSILGIANTIGRLLSGWLADYPKVNTQLLNSICIAIGGVATIFVPSLTTYPLQIAYSIVFGLSMSAFVSLTSIILVELLGLEKLTNAFGLLTFSRGIASMSGPPLAGVIYDMTGSYTLSFISGGGLIVVGALLHFVLLIPWFKRKYIENDGNDRSPEIIEIREIT